MSERPAPPPALADELRPYVDRSEADSMNLIAERLITGRALPRAGFRAELRGRLAELGGSRRVTRPRNLRSLVTAYALTGATCLAFAAIGLTGAGPLSP